MKDKRVRLMGYGLSACFLLIHAAMLALFLYFRVTPMAFFNVGSIAFYLYTLLLVRQEKLWLYSVLVYLEVAAHMSLAVCLVGAEAGFQVTLVGMCTLIFYAEYLSKTLRYRPVSGLALSGVGLALYVISYIYSQRFGPAYPLPGAVSFWLQIAWAVITFLVSMFFLKVFVMITARSERLLSDQAKHDPLTGLLNRAGYEEWLDGRDVGDSTMVLVDIDLFKGVNDTYGHETGDRILQKVSKALLDRFSTHDCVCRLGGDEFVVMASNCSSGFIGEKIRKINVALADTSDGLPPVSISAGAASGESDVRTLYENADKALYKTKENGRGGCSIYEKDERR